MDKIKKLFAWMKRQQFWLLAGFVGIASIAVFAVTASGLGQAISTRIAAINGKYSEVQSVNGKMSTHPNSYSHEKMKAQLAILEKDVEQAWVTQYEHQIGLMAWPTGTFQNEQKANIFRSLRPVEKFVPFPPEGLERPLSLITDTDKGIYRDYISSTFPSIVKIIGTEWKATTKSIPIRQSTSGSGSYGAGAAGGSGYDSMSASSSDPSASMGSDYSSPGSGYGGQMGGMGMPINKDIVIWSQASQQKLMNEILPWYNPKKLPSILDIYYTQEDIWLLNNIMEIIRRTNSGAREHFQAVIKEIEFIRMGRKANRDAGVLTKMPSMSSGGGMNSEYGDMSGDMSSSAGGASDMSYSSGGEGGGSDSEVDPADGRYISFAQETFFEPRLGEEIRESIKSIQASNAVDAVAKRVPIRIRVKMDPSKVHQLITQCGNAPFMFEVFQVRINTAAAAEGSSGGAGSYGGGAYGGGSSYPGASDSSSYGDPSSSMGSDMGDYSSGAYGASGYGGDYASSSGGLSGSYPGAGGSNMVGSNRQPQQTIVGVELYGLIYLYNPYDKESLGGADAEDAESTDDSGESSDNALEQLNANLESNGGLPQNGVRGNADPALNSDISSDAVSPNPTTSETDGALAEPNANNAEAVPASEDGSNAVPSGVADPAAPLPTPPAEGDPLESQ